MEPVISIIVPNHNHAPSLPSLFDSILAQDMPELEVIVVDDCSDAPYGEIIEQYTKRGLPIRFLKLEERQYQAARYPGMEMAKGKIITFADADDILLGTGVLKKHVDIFLAEKPDILHFRAAYVDERGTVTGYINTLDPFAPAMHGHEIFRHFAHLEYGHSLWCRFFSRQLVEKVLPLLNDAPPLRRAGDVYLTTLFMAHAKSYTGSDMVGYGYNFFPGKYDSYGPEYMHGFYQILKTVAPILKQANIPEEVIQTFRSTILKKLCLHTGRYCRDVISQMNGNISNIQVTSLLELMDYESIIHILLVSNGINASRLTEISKQLPKMP